MKRKGIINRTHIEKLIRMLGDESLVIEFTDYIKESEPEFYAWVNSTAASITADFGAKTELNMKYGEAFFRLIFISLCSGVMLRNIIGDELMEKAMNKDVKVIEDKFQLFMEGKLGDEFYKYPIRGLSKDSTLHMAKENHKKWLDSKKEYTHKIEAMNFFGKLLKDVEDSKEKGSPF